MIKILHSYSRYCPILQNADHREGTTSRHILNERETLIWQQALPASRARARAYIRQQSHLDSKSWLFKTTKNKIRNLMKAIYKEKQIFQKGYPAPFRIALQFKIPTSKISLKLKSAGYSLFMLIEAFVKFTTTKGALAA